MNLLLDCRSISDTPSGIGVYTFNLLAILNDLNINTTCITDVSSNVLLNTAEEFNFPVLEMGESSSHSRRILKYFNFISQAAKSQRMDYIWEPNNIFIPQSSLKTNKTKLICTIHDVFPLFLKNAYPLIYRLYYKWGLHNTIENAHRLIAVSKQTKEEIRKYFHEVNRGDIRVIHNVIDHSTFLEANHCQQKSQKIYKDEYFIYLGNLEKRKGIYYLIYAFEKYIDKGGEKNLILCGNVNRVKNERKIIYNFMKKYPKRIFLEGYVSNDRKIQLLRNPFCKALLFPSLYEGFGIPPIEAFLLGKFSVVPDIPIYRETIENNAFFYPVKDLTDNFIIDNLAKALFQLEKVKIEIDPYQQKYIAKKFSRDTISKSIQQLFK